MSDKTAIIQRISELKKKVTASDKQLIIKQIRELKERLVKTEKELRLEKERGLEVKESSITTALNLDNKEIIQELKTLQSNLISLETKFESKEYPDNTKKIQELNKTLSGDLQEIDVNLSDIKRSLILKIGELITVIKSEPEKEIKVIYDNKQDNKLADKLLDIYQILSKIEKLLLRPIVKEVTNTGPIKINEDDLNLLIQAFSNISIPFPPPASPSFKNLASSPERASVIKIDGKDVVLITDVAENIKSVEDGNITYMAFADPGTPTTQSKWQCIKIDDSSGFILTYADGNSEHDNRADSLTLLSYS